MALPIGLENWKNTTHVINIRELDLQTTKELQRRLAILGYYDGSVDGVVGPKTLTGFRKFKADRYLGEPEMLGSSSATSLFAEADPVSEQPAGLNKKPIDAGKLGSATGPSARIPGKSQLVYANQLIDGSRYFTWGEMTHGMTRIPENSTITANIIRVARTLDWIRDKWGQPIAITSGYRPPAVNSRVGGARFSSHLQGLAADIYPIGGDIYKLLDVVRASEVTGLGLGMKRGFIHCDLRSGGRVVFPY